MKYLKRYNTFFLLESVLSIDSDIVDKLKSYQTKNTENSWRKIAYLLLQFIGKDSTKNRFDFIDIDSKNKKNFLVQSGKQKNSQSISKVIRNILLSYDIDFKEHDIKDDTIQKFSDDLIGKLESSKIDYKETTIKIVKGDEIKYWYDQNNSETIQGTELYKSCMKGKMDKLSIYSENPNNVNLVIKLNSEGKLVARALLWKLDYSKKGFEWFLDRVYFNDLSDKTLIFDWIKIEKNYNVNRRDQTTGIIDDVMIVKIKNVLFESYPYIDSFFLYINNKDEKMINDGFLSNISIYKKDPGFEELVENIEENIENHIEFNCNYTDGKISDQDGTISIGDLSNKTLLKGFSESFKNDMLPIDKPLNELKNRIKLIKKLNDSNDVSSIFEIQNISKNSIQKLYYKINDDFYTTKEFKPEKCFNGESSDSSFVGTRIIVYDITDLITEKQLKRVLENIIPESLKYKNKVFMTELDCIIVGIYDKVKNSKKYCTDEYESQKSVETENGPLSFDDITEFLKKEFNLKEDNELIKLRRMIKKD